MLAKQKTGRATAGKGHALHLKKGNDVLVESTVIFELIGEIEDDVGGEAGELLPQKVEIIEYREMLRRAAEGAKGVEDVGLRFPVLRLHLLAQVLI